MKSRTYWLLAIIGCTALISSPAVAQTNRIDKFFNGTPPYNGESLTEPLNQVEGEVDRDTENQQSVEKVEPGTTYDFKVREETPNPAERQIREEVPGNSAN